MTVRVATYNSPARYPNLARDMRRLVDKGAVVIATQENTDRQVRDLCPPGWRFWDAKGRARSAAVFWDPKKVTARKRGLVRIHSGRKYKGGPRYIPWVHLRTPDGPLRFGGIHLAAFKTRYPRNAREFRYQEKRAAGWLRRGKWRVLAGDFNARLPSRTWAPYLSRDGRPSRQVVSGPHRAKIDYVVTNRRGGWRPSRVETMSGGSDHKAVVVDLVRR